MYWVSCECLVRGKHSIHSEHTAVFKLVCQKINYEVGHVQYISILTWLWGFRLIMCKFFKLPFGSWFQMRLSNKENNTKYMSLSWKPHRRVRIFIYQRWPIMLKSCSNSILLDEVEQNIIICQWRADQWFVSDFGFPK